MVPHGDRSNVVIEPFLTDQWYVNAKELAKPAIAAVRDGKTKFVPKNWEKTYFDWMENIQPWCISRQLWWGHQIPAWYGPDGKVFVARTEAEAQSRGRQALRQDDHAQARRGRARHLVLLGAVAVLDARLAGQDAGARALLSDLDAGHRLRHHLLLGRAHDDDGAALHEGGAVPRRLHPRLVRDASGAKMSKSKGNVIDPLGVIDEYGADALRFTLARDGAPGHDIRLGPQDVENNRNFATKLWNAARFVEFNGAARVDGFDPKSAKETLNRWIAHETAKAAAEITQAIEAYGSTRPPARPIASSGTSIATGMSSCRSRC